MAQYAPVPPEGVDNFTDLLLYITQELQHIADVLEGVEDVQLPKLHVEPDKRVDGMLAYADGTDWNPGSGQGVYIWKEDSGAWALLG